MLDCIEVLHEKASSGKRQTFWNQRTLKKQTLVFLRVEAFDGQGPQATFAQVEVNRLHCARRQSSRVVVHHNKAVLGCQ